MSVRLNPANLNEFSLAKSSILFSRLCRLPERPGAQVDFFAQRANNFVRLAALLL
jgi:hypothetical protein